MDYCLTLLLVSCLGLPAASLPPVLAPTPTTSMPTFSLDAFQWKNRLLLVFAPDRANPAYQSQLRLLEQQQAELVDRNLLVIQVLAAGESVAAGQSINPATAAQLRQQFDVQPDQFCLILVGKDGTEKRRDAQPTLPATLYSQIDAMPMRQREMREK